MESENESETDENYDDDALWGHGFNSRPNRTPEEKDPQEPDFMKMMAEMELELAQKKLEEEATEEAIKELARQDFSDNVADPDQALIKDQKEIYKMIQMDLEASKSRRSGRTGGNPSSAPRDPGSVESGDIEQIEAGVESSAEQVDEKASDLITQPSGYDQAQSDTANKSRQVTVPSVPDRVLDDLDEKTESVARASEASVNDSTIYGEGHLIKQTNEKVTRPIGNITDQEQLKFAVEVMGEDMEKLKLNEEEFFKKPEEEDLRKASKDSSSKADSSKDEGSEKDEDGQDDDGCQDGSPPDDSPPNNSLSDHFQDDHEDPSQNGTPRDKQDDNQHQSSQSGESSKGAQDNNIAEGDGPQTLTFSEKKLNGLPPVLKAKPKATIPQLISEVQEWALLALSILDSEDLPSGGLRNVVQSLMNFSEAILRICNEKDGRGVGEGEVGGVENRDTDISSLIGRLMASKLACEDNEQVNSVSQQAEAEESEDGDLDIPKLIPDCAFRKSVDDQEAVSKNKADPSVDAEEIVDSGPRSEEQTSSTESSSNDEEEKEDLAAIAEKVIHWAYEGFEQEMFCPRPEYNNYTNRLAEDLWKRQYQLCMAQADFEAEKVKFRDMEFDMMESQKQKERDEKDQELKKREDAVKLRESVVVGIERCLNERDNKLRKREKKMNMVERKLEGTWDGDGEDEGEGGDCEKNKKCKNQ